MRKSATAQFRHVLVFDQRTKEARKYEAFTVQSQDAATGKGEESHVQRKF